MDDVDLGVREERMLLECHGGIPVFVTHHPAHIKFFNMKRTTDGRRAYSVDLLMPPLGESVGGAVREQRGDVVKRQLRESSIASFMEAAGGRVEEAFREYLLLFDQEQEVIRGGFGIGFERFVAEVADIPASTRHTILDGVEAHLGIREHPGGTVCIGWRSGYYCVTPSL